MLKPYLIYYHHTAVVDKVLAFSEKGARKQAIHRLKREVPDVFPVSICDANVRLVANSHEDYIDTIERLSWVEFISIFR